MNWGLKLAIAAQPVHYIKILHHTAARLAANRTCHKHHPCLSLNPSLVEPQVLIPAESWHSLLLDGEELYAEEEQGPQTAQMAAH